ncbi:MAG: glycosyltransferase family 4 protein [Opitutales bacterium]|nr:glycosyltransferase family 4 protein [Opitutales bacterium]
MPRRRHLGSPGGNSVDRLYLDFDQKVADWLAGRLRSSDQYGVYAYEDGAEATFRIARARGVPAVYELPIGYWRTARRILEPELERWPEWRATLINVDEPLWKLERKDRELDWADRIVVASSFTRKSLEDYPGTLAPVEVIPYGAPTLPSLKTNSLATRAPGPLRALFVGSLGLRKGLPYLFAAAESLGSQVKWTFIGQPVAECAALMEGLKAHRWIPTCPNTEILEEMRKHDILVLPSLFEGFGLVLIEALAAGIPVIATAHTAAPDLLTDGEAGFIVPVGDSQAIAAGLQRLVDEPDRLEDMKAKASATAKRWTWERYAALMESYLGSYG